ncbi:MAG: AAA family ATPase, partial [Acidimicrobiia bacterium]|nr:AAA family ATPase [Acidimicrobiia bacterium]
MSFDYGGDVDHPPILVQLLGGFNLRYQGRDIRPLPRKAVSLFAYLVMNRDRPQTRDLLAGRFWSDLSEDKARKRLSNVLWQIRGALRELDLHDLIEANTGTVRVSSRWTVEIDVEEFERRLDNLERESPLVATRGRLAESLSALVSDYPGDLLAGHYDDWIDFDRSRVKERFAGALWQLIRIHKGRSDYVTALRYARQLVGHDQLAEESHREVMRLCALLGQASAAERQYLSCRRLLEDELGVEPSWETTELMERIGNEASSAAAPLVAIEALETPIVGRSRERALLLSRVDDLMAGCGGLILIEGEPGIGKSRLVEDVIDSAEWRGARVLGAGHTEPSRLRPYQGLQEALSPATTGLRGEHLAEVIEPVWLEQASQIFPELRQLLAMPGGRGALRPQEEPSRMNEALARVLLAQGGLGPTLVVLEDVHWCDDDSMRVLANLGQRAVRSGVLICLTYRRFEAEQSDTIWKSIAALEATGGSTRVVLGALNRAEIRQLVVDEIGPGALPNRIVERLVEESGGNPLFVVEALQDPQALLLEDVESSEP